jgi:transposase
VSTSGWAPKGHRCYAAKRATRTARYNIIAALNKNLLFAPFLFEGYSNSQIYETYLKKILIPALRPGMVLVIDNARFHKSQRIIDLVESAGCKILFLPPYSPDLNPIEHYWSSLKSAIRTVANYTQSFWNAAINVLTQACIT